MRAPDSIQSSCPPSPRDSEKIIRAPPTIIAAAVSALRLA
jgi:hypothetical protein